MQTLFGSIEYNWVRAGARAASRLLAAAVIGWITPALARLCRVRFFQHAAETAHLDLFQCEGVEWVYLAEADDLVAQAGHVLAPLALLKVQTCARCFCCVAHPGRNDVTYPIAKHLHAIHEWLCQLCKFQSLRLLLKGQSWLPLVEV